MLNTNIQAAWEGLVKASELIATSQSMNNPQISEGWSLIQDAIDSLVASNQVVIPSEQTQGD